MTEKAPITRQEAYKRLTLLIEAEQALVHAQLQRDRTFNDVQEVLHLAFPLITLVAKDTK